MVDPNLVINGTPEPAVIFGTESDSSGLGSVTAVNEDTGAVLWSSQTSSGVESSPALDDGQVYVATDDGTFYDLNEQTGTVQGQLALTPDVTTGVPESSPVIDDSTVHPSVVVGDGDDVTAMNLTIGTVLWTRHDERTGDGNAHLLLQQHLRRVARRKRVRLQHDRCTPLDVSDR